MLRQYYLILLDEADESGPLDFDGLAGAIIECHDEMEEVRLPQVAGRLLLEVCTSDAQTVEQRKRKLVVRTRCCRQNGRQTPR